MILMQFNGENDHFFYFCGLNFQITIFTGMINGATSGYNQENGVSANINTKFIK